jgi:hypothetical protein
MKLFFSFAFTLMSATQALAHGMSEEDKKRILDAGLIEYMWLGAKHMVTGYDHLLFLFGVIFFLTKFKDIVKFVTAFTIGHSITLIFATFLGIKANYYLIDAVIALTVIYKGFDNIDGFKKYLNMRSPNLIAAVFAFGLIPLGDPSSLLGRIIAFNIGVELGQIAALVVFVGLLGIWRRRPSFQQLSFAANCLLIATGALLFLMQLHGFQHDVYSDDFGFNKDGHIHHHQDMNEEIN